MRLKHRFLLVVLGALGSVCLSLCYTIAAEAQVVKSSATIAQGGMSPPLPPADPPSTDPRDVRAGNQRMNAKYDKQSEDVRTNIEQSRQERQQHLNDTYQKHDSLEKEGEKQAVVPTRTPFQPPSPPLAVAPSPPLPPDSSSPQTVPSPPLPPDLPVSNSSQPEAESPIAQAPVSPPAQSSAPSSEQAPLASSGKSSTSPKSGAKATVKKLSLGDLSFACGSANGTPATIAKLNDREIGVILWTSKDFVSIGFDPQTRCNDVSKRFEAYRKAKQLSYLTIGKLNNQPVLCVTSRADGSCGDGTVNNAGLLLTLKPGSNANETLEQLSNVLVSKANTPTEPLKE